MKYKLHFPYITFIIDKTWTIHDLLTSFHLSRKTIHLLKQNKDYQLNRLFVPDTTLMKPGDQLTIKAYQNNDDQYEPVFHDLDIIYEDDFLLVVNKPPFISVYPNHPNKTDSLSNIVSGYYTMQGYDIPVRYIHRLDDETSGLVLFCKCSFIQPLLDYQLSTKEIYREYLAVVQGHIYDKLKHDIITYIARDRHQNKMRVSRNGQKAHTTYQAISYHENLTLIRCQLHTGRRHQIRVHMSSIGYPLLGDKLYNQSSSLINRQALHAYQMILEHPITKEKMTLSCHLPNDIQMLIDPHK